LRTFAAAIASFRLRAGLLAGAVAFGLLPAPLEASVLQCVQYAREVTQVPLKGDAWTWWNKAPGVRLPRGQDPEAGGILVFSKTKRLPRGHVSVVTGILNSREIVVSHANWAARGTARGRVEQDVRVLDVSPMNDWSEVRVWYAPSDSYGQRVYPTYGFIYTLEALPGL
jgi:surface antigen